MDEILLLLLTVVGIFIITTIDWRGKIKFRINKLEKQAESQAKEIAELKSHIELLERQSASSLTVEQVENIETTEDIAEPMAVAHTSQEEAVKVAEIDVPLEAPTAEYAEEVQEQSPAVETPKPTIFEADPFTKSESNTKPKQPNPIWQ